MIDLSQPVLFCPGLSGPVPTCPDCLNLSKHVLSCPDLSLPLYAFLDLSWLVLTCPGLSQSFLSWPDLSWAVLTCCLSVCRFVKFKFIELLMQLKTLYLSIFNVNIGNNPFNMSVRGGLPSSICSQIQKFPFLQKIIFP